MTEPALRPMLRLIEGDLEQADSWSWFCGHCGVPSPNDEPPLPNARVCTSCSMGLLLEARSDAVPEPGSAFLVVDSQLLVQAVSSAAENLLRIREENAINLPLTQLLVPADAEAQGSTGVAALIARAAADEDTPARAFVRPADTYGVRIRARIASCGPPRAALVVLDENPGPRLRAV